jgi:hypothetical protein
LVPSFGCGYAAPSTLSKIAPDVFILEAAGAGGPMRIDSFIF